MNSSHSDEQLILGTAIPCIISIKQKDVNESSVSGELYFISVLYSVFFSPIAIRQSNSELCILGCQCIYYKMLLDKNEATSTVLNSVIRGIVENIGKNKIPVSSVHYFCISITRAAEGATVVQLDHTNRDATACDQNLLALLQHLFLFIYLICIQPARGYSGQYTT